MTDHFHLVGKYPLVLCRSLISITVIHLQIIITFKTNYVIILIKTNAEVISAVAVNPVVCAELQRSVLQWHVLEGKKLVSS